MPLQSPHPGLHEPTPHAPPAHEYDVTCARAQAPHELCVHPYCGSSTATHFPLHVFCLSAQPEESGVLASAASVAAASASAPLASLPLLDPELLPLLDPELLPASGTVAS